MMKRKLVWTAVLAAMVAAGTTGVYAAPTLEDHETRIVDLEKLTDKIDDRSETDHLAIKGLKQNKADKAETEAAIKENKDMITQELKDRKSADRILNKAIADEASAREQAVAEEAAAREAADNDIKEKLETEANFRKLNVKDLNKRVDTVQGNVDKERHARMQMDMKLHGLIKDEASAREEADKRLQANIDTEATTREEADKRLQTNIDTEASARKAGDTFLQGQIDSLHTETNKGLAKVTALTGLHPLDFDPANKWNVAVATGTYKSETSVALGAFYRPNRDVMFSFGSSISNGDNAYTFGASVKLGRGSSMKGTASVSELYDMIGRMQEQLALQQKKIEELEAKK
ncbi:YadA C-terminal domain-containing protein [Dialister invisus]|uniref:YadA C-terminal domain-containing protein n=1 Tax=Dialister invisus TaxID=218538 RepID=UPI0028800192|nr:YadA C-terminal domain-containing protein [Dialister invisus]